MKAVLVIVALLSLLALDSAWSPSMAQRQPQIHPVNKTNPTVMPVRQGRCPSDMEMVTRGGRQQCIKCSRSEVYDSNTGMCLSCPYGWALSTTPRPICTK